MWARGVSEGVLECGQGVCMKEYCSVGRGGVGRCTGGWQLAVCQGVYIVRASVREIVYTACVYGVSKTS